MTLVRNAATACRSTATGLQQQAADCRQKLAANPKATCDVTYRGSSGARRISPAAADSMAGQFISTATKLEGSLDTLRKYQIKVEADEAAVRALGFERTAKEFEEWEKLSEEARRDFFLKFADVAIGHVLIGAKEATPVVKSLNPWQSQKIIGKFKSAGIEDPKLFELIRSLAGKSARAKGNWIKEQQELLDGLKKIKDSFFTGVTVGLNREHLDYKLAAEALATALSWLIQDPALELVVLDFQLFAAYVYASTGVVQVDKLLAVADKNLATMRDLKLRMEEDWKALNAALATLPRPCSLE